MSKQNKKKRNFIMKSSIITAAITGTAIGVVTTLAGVSLKKQSQKKKNLNNIKLEEENYQNLVSDFPELIRQYGDFTDDEIKKYLDIIKRTRDTFGDSLLFSISQMLYLKNSDIIVKSSLEDIRAYFDSMEILLNLDDKVLTPTSKAR